MDFESPLYTSGSRRHRMSIAVFSGAWDFRLVTSITDFTTSVVATLFHHFHEVKNADNSLLLILSHFRKIVDSISSRLVSISSR